MLHIRTLFGDFCSGNSNAGFLWKFYNISKIRNCIWDIYLDLWDSNMIMIVENISDYRRSN